MRKSSKSSKILPVNIVQDNNLPPGLIVVDQNIFNNQKFKEKIGIKSVSIVSANFQPIGNIASVDNLYVELGNNYYVFDINKIEELFLVEGNGIRDNFINVILLVESQYYEFPYGNIKVQVGGSTSASSLSAKASAAKKVAPSSSESIMKDNIRDFNSKIPGNFFDNNAKKLGEYIEGGKVSGKIEALKSRIDLLTLSESKQPDIRDPDLQFFVLISPQNSNPNAQIYTLYQLNGENITQKQYITNNTGQIAGVLFTYIDDKQIAVDMDELYYKKALVAIPRGEKGRSARFDPSSSSPSFASSKSVPPSTSSIGLPPPPTNVLPLKPAKVAAEDHLYTEVNIDDINGLKRFTLPFDTNTENLYFSNNKQLYEIPNVSNVEPVAGSDDSVEVTQINNEGIPVKLQYNLGLLGQAPKNDDTLLRANLQKIYSNLQDSAKREVAAGLQQPTPSQIQFDKFNSIMGNESIGDLDERYNVYLKSVSEPPKSDVEVNVTQPVNGITNYNSNTFNKRFYNLYAREREGGTYKIYQLKNIVDVIPQKDNSVRVTLRKNDGSIYIKNFYNKGQLTQAPKTDAEIDEEIIKEYNELKSASEKEAAASGVKSGISSFATPKSDDFEKFKTTMGLTSGLPPSLVAAASSSASVSAPASSSSSVSSSSVPASVSAPSSVPVAPLVAKYKALYNYKPPPPGPTTIKTSTPPAATATAPAPPAPPAGPPAGPPAPGSSNKSTAKGLQPGSSKSSSSQSSPSQSSSAATVVNQTSSIKPPEIVPNELFIVLNTSIPGSQKIF